MYITNIIVSMVGKKQKDDAFNILKEANNYANC